MGIRRTYFSGHDAGFLGLVLALQIGMALGEDPELAADPFAADEAKAPKSERMGDLVSVPALLRVEVYEIPAMEAIEVMDQELSGGELRKKVRKMVKEGEAALASMHAARLEIGRVALMESVVEDINPTEYESPEALPENLPLLRPEKQLSPTQRQQKTALTFASPGAFETKLLGITVEGSASVVTVEKGVWDLALSHSRVIHLKDESWVEGTVTMPIFKVDDVRVDLRVRDGEWTMCSCQPPVGEDGRADLVNTRMVLVNLKKVAR